jgi:hypothetical protein
MMMMMIMTRFKRERFYVIEIINRVGCYRNYYVREHFVQGVNSFGD